MAEAFWSGIPRNIVLALRHAGHTVTAIGPLPPPVTLIGRIKGRLHRHLANRTYLINRDPAIFRRRTEHAAEQLSRCPPIDAVITFYPPDAAFLRSSAPIFVIHDATWHQLLDTYPGYERRWVAEETIRGGDLLDRLGLSNSQRIIYSSRWAAEDAATRYGIDRRKIDVIPFGANLVGSPQPHELDRWLGQRGTGPCRLLFVGIDWHRKGGDLAIAAAAELQRQGLKVQFDIVGPPPPAEMPDFVRWHGFLSRQQPAEARVLADLFAGADFFLLPSRAECYGVALCEAAAYGLPTATARVGGIPEIIGDGAWGAALPASASAADYAHWIIATYRDRVGYERMARAAFDDFHRRLNWQAFCHQLTALITEATGTAAPSEAARQPVGVP